MKKLYLNTDKIKKELGRLNVTQSWLAKKMGISRSRISQILIKKPITQAHKIGQALNIDAKDLIK